MSKEYESHRCDFGQPYTLGTDMQQVKAGSRAMVRGSMRRRNPSTVRLKQMGPSLIPRGKGYAHMADKHFRYMP